jgi:hypothetical protein
MLEIVLAFLLGFLFSPIVSRITRVLVDWWFRRKK